MRTGRRSLNRVRRTLQGVSGEGGTGPLPGLARPPGPTPLGRLVGSDPRAGPPRPGQEKRTQEGRASARRRTEGRREGRRVARASRPRGSQDPKEEGLGWDKRGPRLRWTRKG